MPTDNHVRRLLGLAALAPVLLTSQARDIVFPPVAPVIPPSQVRLQHNAEHKQPSMYHQVPSKQEVDDPTYWPETIYAGLTTFAGLPWAHCLAGLKYDYTGGHEEHSEAGARSSFASFARDPHLDVPVPPYDIAVVGAPFDTATTGRPGTRFGPGGIRRGSQRIASHGAWSAFTHKNVLVDWAAIADCGDVPLTFLDNTVALSQLQQAHSLLSSRTSQAHLAFKNNGSIGNDASDKPSVPRIIMLGGDHTTTLAALRVAHQHWGPTSVIHFDSHIDTWDPDVLGGGFSSYAGVNHGTFLHIAHEEGLLHNNSNIHAGIRAPVSNKKHDWRNDRRCGFDIITARDIDHMGIGGIISQIKQRVGDNNVYISVDIDVLDPAYAPGTGTAEVGGWTTRELLSIIDGLTGLNVIGADVVEVSPAYDNAGETTVLAAAEIVMSLMGLMVETPVDALVDLGRKAENRKKS